LTQLRKLYLGYTQVTDAGLKNLNRLTKLQNLQLPVVNVTDVGIEDLQKALPNCQIKQGR
jgi:S-adenosylhomocysteine hydrolase